MTTLSQEKQLESISTEINELALRKRQLNDRLNLLLTLREFRRNGGFHGKEFSSEDDECEKIQQQLEILTERKIQLQKLKDSLNFQNVHTTTMLPVANEIFNVERPPSFAAPQVILDLNKLPRHPAQTQCPYCEQYITTEVSKVIGSTVWLACVVSTCLGCIAGCCLIPFCINTFKDVVHKCPKCRSQIHTCTKM